MRRWRNCSPTTNSTSSRTPPLTGGGARVSTETRILAPSGSLMCVCATAPSRLGPLSFWYIRAVSGSHGSGSGKLVARRPSGGVPLGGLRVLTWQHERAQPQPHIPCRCWMRRSRSVAADALTQRLLATDGATGTGQRGVRGQGEKAGLPVRGPVDRVHVQRRLAIFGAR